MFLFHACASGSHRQIVRDPHSIAPQYVVDTGGEMGRGRRDGRDNALIAVLHRRLQLHVDDQGILDT